MAREVVFYFDILGFRTKSGGQADAAVDALTDLATLLGTDAIAHLMGQWHHRYALSDSVFLTHSDPDTAVRQAATLVFNLVNLTLNDEEPLLVRGAMAKGEVRHLKGIFLQNQEPANLVGQGVVDAVELEQQSGLKGPRLLLSEDLACAVSQPLADWLIRTTSTPGVCEALWLLPGNPTDFPSEELSVKSFCDRALELFKVYGGHSVHGAHYREFLLLAARSVERARHATANGSLGSPAITAYLDAARVKDACESTIGIPVDYKTTLLGVVESLK